jgi:hypothetical protein
MTTEQEETGPEPGTDREQTNDAEKRQVVGQISSRKLASKFKVTLLLFALVLALPPALTAVLSDDIESVIAEDGLRPIRPVSNTYNVGSLHIVNFKGQVGNAVCQSNKVYVLSGAGEDRVIANIGFADASLDVHGNTTGGTVESESKVELEVRLSNIKFMTAKSESQLRKILYHDLISEPACSEQIDLKLEAGYCLAQILSIMVADGTYTVNGKIHSSFTAQQEKFNQAKIRGELDYDESVFKVGKNLHYGVKLDSLCLTPGDAKLVRVVPDHRWWVMTPLVNVFHTTWKYLHT